MPKPLDADLRAAILTDIRNGQLSARAIAKKHGVAASTVSKLAGDNGVVDAFERAHTEKATRAREADSRSERAALKADLLADARRLRDRAWQPYTIAMGTPQGVEKVTLDLPPLGDVRSAYTAIGIVVDKHLALDRHDNAGGTGVEDAVSMLTNLAAGIRRTAWANHHTPPGTPPVVTSYTIQRMPGWTPPTSTYDPSHGPTHQPITPPVRRHTTTHQ